MSKIIFTFGTTSGLVVIGGMLLSLTLRSDGESMSSGEVVGYLIMIVALSVIFVGVKRYRDRELGGVIRFGQAFLLGLGISLVAGVAYVVAWEGYLAVTDHAFIEEYTRSVIEAKRSAGLANEKSSYQVVGTISPPLRSISRRSVFSSVQCTRARSLMSSAREPSMSVSTSRNRDKCSG